MISRPYGMYTENGNAAPPVRASDYSDGRYDGVCCGVDRSRSPVVIMRSRRTDPLRWKVMYGFSQIFFRTFEDAVEFCSSRGFQLVKDQVRE